MNALEYLEKRLEENMTNNRISIEKAQEIINTEHLMSFQTWSKNNINLIIRYIPREKASFIITKEYANRLVEAQKQKDRKKAIRAEIKKLQKRIAELEAEL